MAALIMGDGHACDGKLISSENGGFDKLSDDVLIRILSRMNVKEAARTSVLAHRWRYLWRFVNGTLKFDRWNTATANVRKRENFLAWANAVVKHHQFQCIEGMVIKSYMGAEDFEDNDSSIACAVDDLVYFAMNKQVQRLKLRLLFRHMYSFPVLKMLLASYSLGFGSPFYRLRDLRLVHVNVEDEEYNIPIVALPDLPQLCSLKRLEVQVHTEGCHSLLFFTSLINASPQLREFRIEVRYSDLSSYLGDVELSFPVIGTANAVKFVHSNLKVVEIKGYVGCSSEEEMLLELIKIGPLIERVAIDTETDYYYFLQPQRSGMHLTEIVATTRNEAKERARHFVSSFLKQIEVIVT
ncbi:putative FBD-associated F-box protein At5g56690 [Salvia hispanica]|uniref:putative FBD-associated F-box protein At5g56690 n=1 Tax=Salvia hispanica TaxID=49212 RepID=UPI002009046F|nr:putative FBD-associated F-box protein At5g56690 [Salvia hispanica]